MVVFLHNKAATNCCALINTETQCSLERSSCWTLSVQDSHEVKHREKLADAAHNGEMCTSTRMILLTDQEKCHDELCDPLGKLFFSKVLETKLFDYFAVVLRRKEVGNPLYYFDKSFEEYKNGFESKGNLKIILT